MASGIFAILDDIAALMDDVAVAAKVATKKTSAILGDDLAVNAEKATGFLSSREIPVLWRITKGSFLNKLIIVPIVILLNIYLPIAIKGILLIGGCYLAYEGMEKIIEYFFHKPKKGEAVIVDNTINPEEQENAKVKSAIMTDFILSVEIVILALTAIKEFDQFDQTVQIIGVSIVAIIATVGVYGLVALIVRMDDLGYKLIKRSENKGFLNTLGNGLVKGLPVVIKALSVIGTIALILVSGGIFVHNINYLHHLWPNVPSIIKEIAAGIIMGIVVVGVVSIFQKIIGNTKAKTTESK